MINLTNKLYRLAQLLVVVNSFVLVGLCSLFVANIVIAVTKVEYHTVLSFKEMLLFIPAFIITFIGLSFSVSLHEAYLNS